MNKKMSLTLDELYEIELEFKRARTEEIRNSPEFLALVQVRTVEKVEEKKAADKRLRDDLLAEAKLLQAALTERLEEVTECIDEWDDHDEDDIRMVGTDPGVAGVFWCDKHKAEIAAMCANDYLNDYKGNGLGFSGHRDPEGPMIHLEEALCDRCVSTGAK